MSAPHLRRCGRALRRGAVLLVALTAAAPAFAAKPRDSAPAPRRDAVVRDVSRRPAAAIASRPAPTRNRAAEGRGAGPAAARAPVARDVVLSRGRSAPRDIAPPRLAGRVVMAEARRLPPPTLPPRGMMWEAGWMPAGAWRAMPPVIPGWQPIRPSRSGPRGRNLAAELAPYRIGPGRPATLATFRATPPRPIPASAPATPTVLAAARPPVIEMPEPVALQELALAPRTPLAGPGSPLPQPLPPSDAARLRRIFAAQARGDVAEAARESERLDDRRLIGHVLADRWSRPGAPEPTVSELRAWLSEHADHPDAPRLYALLLARSPAGAAGLPPPPGSAAEAEAAANPELPPEEREPAAATRNVTRNPALDRTVREMIGRGDHAGALAHIARTRGMTPAYAAALQTEVAQSLFAGGGDAEALRVAAAAARLPGAPAQASFVAGIAAWGLGQYETALPHFEAAARSDTAPAVLRAAASFWTARAAVRARRPQAYVPWMLQAAQEPRTFYGLLARRSLGMPFGFAWEGDVAGDAETRALTETAGGWRALALLQVGQRSRAEAELRLLLGAGRGNASLNRAMLAVATSAGITDLATDLAAAAQRADGRPRDFARYPVPALSPRSGWRVDPALIYGLARQESNFDPAAVSPAGARGLMQVMPATAAYITGDAALRDEGRDRLHDPAFSLELAQRYLIHLSGQEGVGGDLIRMLTAYNAGPGNLQRWLPANGRRDDPFLFIESIPYSETRAFVQRVLGYSFIYASRLGLPSPALDTLAAGGSPRLVGVEELARMVARSRQGGAR